MTDAVTRAVLLSRLGVAKQTAIGTAAGAPAYDLDPTDFEPTDGSNPIDFDYIRQSRNTTGEERQGARRVALRGTLNMHSVKGSQLWAWALGHDTMSGAANVAATIGAAIAVGDTSAQVTLGTAPAGVGTWVGTWVEFTKTGLTTPERKLIMSYSAGVAKVHSAFQNAFATTDTARTPVQHVIDENTGSTKFDLDYFTAWCQFADYYEWLMQDGFISSLALRGNNRTIDVAMESMFCAPPAENDTLTTWTKATAEKSDPPYIVMDGGLITPFDAAGDPKMHNRIKQFEYTLGNETIPDEYGGAAYQTEQYTPGRRTQGVTWREAAGQGGKRPTIYIDFVRGERTMPAGFGFVNKATNAALGIWLPFCSVPAYDPQVAAGEVFGYNGRLLPREDPNTDKSVRISIVNGTTVAF